MKKLLIALLFVFVVVGVLYYLNRGSQSPMSPPIVTQETNQVSSQPPEANFVETVSNASPVTITQPINTVETSEPINALTTTNLEQWKSILPGLKYSDNFCKWDSWVMQQDRKIGVPVMLGENGQAVRFNVWFFICKIGIARATLWRSS